MDNGDEFNTHKHDLVSLARKGTLCFSDFLVNWEYNRPNIPTNATRCPLGSNCCFSLPATELKYLSNFS